MSNPESPNLHDDTTEVERRFLVRDASIVMGLSWALLTQAYFEAPDGYAMRLRLRQHLEGEEWGGQTAFLSVKGPRVAGERWEEEFPLRNTERAIELLEKCTHVVQKRRYSLIDGGATWEVDVFMGENEGLVIAELEGKGDWIWDVRRPTWALREITHDTKYNNERLAFEPIHTWALIAADEGDDDFDWLGE